MLPGNAEILLEPNTEAQIRQESAGGPIIFVLLEIVMLGTVTVLAIMLNHDERKHVSPSSFPQ